MYSGLVEEGESTALPEAEEMSLECGLSLLLRRSRGWRRERLFEESEFLFVREGSDGEEAVAAGREAAY